MRQAKIYQVDRATGGKSIIVREKGSSGLVEATGWPQLATNAVFSYLSIKRGFADTQYLCGLLAVVSASGQGIFNGLSLVCCQTVICEAICGLERFAGRDIDI